MSLLTANGHSDARYYPLYRVWEEVGLTINRIDKQLASESLLIQMAVGSLFDKDAGKTFADAVKRLSRD